MVFPSILQPDAFLAQLDELEDADDSIDINNCDDVRQANTMVGGPESEEGLRRFEQLHAQFPDSGNICALYAQALWMCGRAEEALTIANHAFGEAKSKSQVAAQLGQIHLREGNFVECVSWYIRSVSLASHRSRASFTAAYLGALYSAAAAATGEDELEAVARRLLENGEYSLDGAARQHILSMAQQECNGEVAAAMNRMAERQGWCVAGTRRDESPEQETVTTTHLPPPTDPADKPSVRSQRVSTSVHGMSSLVLETRCDLLAELCQDADLVRGLVTLINDRARSKELSTTGSETEVSQELYHLLSCEVTREEQECLHLDAPQERRLELLLGLLAKLQPIVLQLTASAQQAQIELRSCLADLGKVSDGPHSSRAESRVVKRTFRAVQKKIGMLAVATAGIERCLMAASLNIPVLMLRRPGESVLGCLHKEAEECEAAVAGLSKQLAQACRPWWRLWA